MGFESPETLDDGATARFEKRGTRQGVAVWVLADVSKHR